MNDSKLCGTALTFGNRPLPRPRFLIAMPLLALLVSNAPAQTSTWNGGGGDNLWSTTRNWDVSPDDGFDIVFGTGFDSGTTIDTIANRFINSFTINTTTAFTLIGGDTLTIASGALTRNDVAGTEGNHSINANITLGAAGNFNISGAGTLTIAGVIGDGGNTLSLTKSGNGTLVLEGVNTYAGGTTLSGGRLALGVDNVLPDTGTFDFAGGILDANSRTDTIGALSLTEDSALNLDPGNGSGSLTFASMTASAGKTLTINGWSGLENTTGTDDHIFITADPGATVLSQIHFTGFGDGALWLSGTGEIVPVPEPINVALGVFGAVFVVSGLGRRLRARRQA